MKLRTQRRVASKLLKCGSERVTFDPEQLDKIAQAITREDIRKLISDGVISKKQAKGISRARANVRMFKKRKGLRRGIGKRKGTANARLGDKKKWMLKIRAQRKLLVILKTAGDITRQAYRKLYRMAKGNAFRDKGHLRTSVEQMKKRGDI
ncbi:MAG: 50S ribosomal protein L19e [Deltaproteobacteria bacterium]|nr:50S ribosomal protein L19e [Deltaproteobacteria bacterium]